MSSFYEDFENYLKGQDTPITSQIISDEKADAIERMNIYRDAYALRLMDILHGDFPTIYAILGTDHFFEMARHYLAKYPSTSFSVRYFGQHLAKYLSEESPYCDYNYLSQIADFEWAKGRVFDAPDSSALRIEELSRIAPEAWENLTFAFIPAVTRLVYNYNIPQVWQAVEADRQDREPVELDEPLSWVMWRKDLNPSWYSMSADEDWFFIQARKGLSFGELCEGLAALTDDEETAAVRAAEIVRRWIDEKMLARLND